jgi:hypothetical protein
MSCVARTLTYISDITGFDGREYFENPKQVRTYFKIEVMERNYPDWFKKLWLIQRIWIKWPGPNQCLKPFEKAMPSDYLSFWLIISNKVMSKGCAKRCSALDRKACK